MVCTTQGPVTRRPGFRFIYDLTSIGLDIADPQVREIPFVFNELQAYAMIFFMHTDGSPRLVFGTELGLLVYSATTIIDCPSVPIEEIAFTGAATYPIAKDIGADSDIRVEHKSDAGTITAMVNPTDYTVTINADPTADELVVTTAFTSDGFLRIFSRVSVTEGDIVSLTLPAIWEIEEFDWAQSADEMYIAQSADNPHIIRRYGDECWELVSVVFTEEPVEWEGGTVGAGWPERVTFHQQRLVFAATKLNRQTVWMTQAGDFSSFAVGGTILPSDSVVFTLDSGTQNKIIWLLSSKSLNIGTIGNEWTVTGADRNALTPSNILAQRQTSHGGEDNKPLLVGVTTLFVERYGRVINEFVYDFNIDGYKTSDLAILSTHITESFSIKDWTYQQTPDSVVWSVREDGILLGMTYQRDHQVVGWHVHDTAGEFKTITSIPGNQREDEVWTVVKRVIEGADKYYVEKMDTQFIAKPLEDARFIDSYKEYSGIPANTFAVLDHLEGELVDVIADGTIHPQVTVVGGQITLNNMYSNVGVGKRFISEVWPHLADIVRQDGTLVGRQQRTINLDIDFYKTLGIFIGRYDSEDGEQEEDHPFRVPGDLTGQKVPLFTGIGHITFPEGFDRAVQYFIKSHEPLPCTVRAVVDSVESFD